MMRRLASLVLALLVTTVLAVAAAWGVLGFMRLTSLFPPPPTWLVPAELILIGAIMVYRRWRRRRAAADG